jgi:hypothetical protein
VILYSARMVYKMLRNIDWTDPQVHPQTWRSKRNWEY